MKLNFSDILTNNTPATKYADTSKGKKRKKNKKTGDTPYSADAHPPAPRPEFAIETEPVLELEVEENA